MRELLFIPPYIYSYHLKLMRPENTLVDISLAVSKCVTVVVLKCDAYALSKCAVDALRKCVRNTLPL